MSNSSNNRQKKRRALWLSILLMTAIIIGGGYLFLEIFLLGNNLKKEKVVILIPKNATYPELLDSVENTLNNKNSFRIVAKLLNLETKYRTGRYAFSGKTGNLDIINSLRHGLQTPVNLTLAGNIRTKEKLAAIIGSKLESDSAAIANMLYNKEFIDSLGFNQETILSMFILNTYSVYWTTTPYDLAKRMKKEFDKFWNEERLAKATNIRLTPTEVIILASIVAEETNIKAEYPVIAGVYMNRLINGEKLEADPTVKYACNDPSIKRILFSHLEIDSPYNTYKNSGLPPGPIVIPPIAAIDGVLNYTRHNYRFFCASPTLDGSHLFTNTFAEHSRNAAAYHRAISQ